MNDLESSQSLIEKPTVYGMNLQRLNHRACTPLKSQFSINQPTIEGESYFNRTFTNNWLIPSRLQDRNSRMEKKYQKQVIVGKIRNNKKEIIREIQDELPLMKKENTLENNRSRIYQNNRNNNPLSLQKFSLNLHQLKSSYNQKQKKKIEDRPPNPKKEVLLSFLENPNQNKSNATIFFNPNYNIRPVSKVAKREKKIEDEPKIETAKQISFSPVSQKKIRKISVLSLSQEQSTVQILGLQSQVGEKQKQKQKQKQEINKLIVKGNEKSVEKKKRQKTGGQQVMVKKIKTQSEQIDLYEKKIQDLKEELQKSNNIIKDMKIKELQSEVIKLKQRDKQFDKILKELMKQKQDSTIERLYRNNSESKPLNYKDYRFDSLKREQPREPVEQKKFNSLDKVAKQRMGESLNGLDDKRPSENKGKIRKINLSTQQQQELYPEKRTKTEGITENSSVPKNEENIQKKEQKKQKPIIVKQQVKRIKEKEKNNVQKQQNEVKKKPKQQPKFHILADHQSQMQVQTQFQLINPLKTRQKLENSYAQLKKLSIPEINVNPFKIPQIPSPPLPNQGADFYVNKAKDLCKVFDFAFSELDMIIRRYKNCISFKIIGTQDIAIWSFDGKLYIGGWVQGKEGQGKKQGKGLQFSSNYYYKGQFKQNKKWGSGIAQYYNGNIYEGQWIQGRMDGKGVYFDKQNSVYYKGEWSKGELIGRGVIKFTKKFYYTGQIKRFEKSGKGTQFYENGNIFQGSFEKGQINGYGVYYYPSGEFFVGNFKNGKRNGIGLLLTNKFKDGEDQDKQNTSQKVQQYYYGNFKDGLRAGYGVQRFLDGTYYSGYFFQDLKHGPGIIQKSVGNSVEANQVRVTGIWKNGSLVVKNLRQQSQKVGSGEFQAKK